jgi:hypothetical protein
MLILRRKEGQWVEVRHRSGDLLRIRVYNIRSRFPGQLDMAFEDDARNFAIERPERNAPMSPPGEHWTAPCDPCPEL